MKFTVLATGDVVQFNLHPENDHERKFVGMLAEYEGRAELHHGVDVSECKGGYLRIFRESTEALAITIHKKSAK